MNNVEAIRKMNATELEHGIAGTSASWHAKYASSGVVYVGGLQAVLTEGDLLSIFEQYGTISHINLVRDERTKTPRGFAFLDFIDPRSSVLAVDNLNGIKILDRTIRVDHVENYKYPEGDEMSLNVRPPGHVGIPIGARKMPKGEKMDRLRQADVKADDTRESVAMDRLRAMRKRRAMENDAEKRLASQAHKRPRNDMRVLLKEQNTSRETGSLGKSATAENHLSSSLNAKKSRKNADHLQEKLRRREERAVIRKKREERRERRMNASTGTSM